jgi:nitrogen regulatory protein P-II 1
MRKVEAVIQPHKLDDVREGLSKLSLIGMTVTEVKGCGRQKGHTELYRGAEYFVDLIPKLKLEVVIPEGRVDACIDAITEAAHTGHIGDGKVFVTVVENALRLRTGEQGTEAL